MLVIFGATFVKALCDFGPKDSRHFLLFWDVCLCVRVYVCQRVHVSSKVQSTSFFLFFMLIKAFLNRSFVSVQRSSIASTRSQNCRGKRIGLDHCEPILNFAAFRKFHCLQGGGLAELCCHVTSYQPMRVKQTVLRLVVKSWKDKNQGNRTKNWVHLLILWDPNANPC